MQDLASAIEAAKGGGATPLELPGAVVCTPPRSESPKTPRAPQEALLKSVSSGAGCPRPLPPGTFPQGPVRPRGLAPCLPGPGPKGSPAPEARPL